MLKLLTFSIIFLYSTAPTYADDILNVAGFEKSINDLSRHAQETGDAVAKSFADQALKIIAEWKGANEILINVAFARLDKQSRDLFTNLNNITTRLERDQAVAVVDIQRAMISAAEVINGLPGAQTEPSVTFAYPTVATPGETGALSVHILGPFIARADPRVSGVIEVRKVSEP